MRMLSQPICLNHPNFRNWKLSFGIKATANLFDLDASKLNPVNAADPSLQNYSKFSPNIGAGIYLHSD